MLSGVAFESGQFAPFVNQEEGRSEYHRARRLEICGGQFIQLNRPKGGRGRDGGFRVDGPDFIVPAGAIGASNLFNHNQFGRRSGERNQRKRTGKNGFEQQTRHPLNPIDSFP